MGKVNAGICAHTLINDFNCTKIVQYIVEHLS